MKEIRGHLWSTDFLPELVLGLENLRAHKLRSLLTMMGMIFGVAAVVAMLSIGAGAQQEVMAFIEQLGVRNLIVEAREAGDHQALQKVRQLSAGLSFKDMRVIQSNLDTVTAATARKRFTPTKLSPRPLGGDMPVIYGVSPAYAAIGNLRMASGRFFDEAENKASAAPVAVIGEARRRHAVRRRRSRRPLREGQRAVAPGDRRRRPAIDGPDRRRGPARAGSQQSHLRAALLVDLPARGRPELAKDEIDGIYLQMQPSNDVPAAAALVRGILDVAHRGAGDFTIVSPAELLAEQRRTQRIFEMVMVAIASISLLVGGIGIMNIMLASVLERTREIGVRRAIGARQRDVVRQFLIETTIISLSGGVAGIILGVALSQLIGVLAGWSTIVTTSSIVLAFGVSVAIGIVFGLYPAVRASRLDPVKALHYE